MSNLAAMRIEIISGSPRPQSITKRVALHLLDRITETTEHQVGLIDLVEWQLPAMQSVFKSVETTPDPYKKLSSRMFAAEAFILVSPEYNGSYSPSMKNLLDHYPKQYHRSFGIVTASNGATGGIRASQQMQLLINALFGIASPYMLIVPKVEEKFNSRGGLIEESFDFKVHNFLTEFLWLAERLNSVTV